MAKYRHIFHLKPQIFIMDPFAFNSSGGQMKLLYPIAEVLQNEKERDQLIESFTVLKVLFSVLRNLLLFDSEEQRKFCDTCKAQK